MKQQWSNLKYCTRHFLRDLRKITTNFNKNSKSPDKEINSRLQHWVPRLPWHASTGPMNYSYALI